MSSMVSKLSTKHSYYPLFLDIAGKLCIIIGGGRTAERKVAMLLKFSAGVKLISPKITKNLLRLKKAGKIEIIQREYRNGDLEGALLVFAATDCREINMRITKEAETKSIPVNVVDDPVLCDFIVPSIVKKPPITIAISTSGNLPLLSKKLREELNDYITKDYIKYVNTIGKFRKYLIKTVENSQTRKKIMAEINRTSLKELADMDIKEIKKMFLKEIK